MYCIKYKIKIASFERYFDGQTPKTNRKRYIFDTNAGIEHAISPAP